jgi:hypothetical protein
VKRAAAHLLDLHNDRNRLAFLRQQARQAAKRFSLESMVDGYVKLFREVLLQPSHVRPPEPIDNCKLPPGLQPGWWFKLPEPVKNHLRAARELARSHFRVP